MIENHVQDELTAYALGELGPNEHRLVKTHLQSCPECRLDFEQLVLTLGIFAMTDIELTSPPPAVRQRLLNKIERSKPRPLRARSRWVPVFAMAILAIVVAVVGIQNYRLRQQLRKAETSTTAPESVADAARRLLLSPEAIQVVLRPASAKPEPEGRAIFIPRSTSLVFIASDLQPPPAGKAYQLWLLPISGRPISAGLFKPDTGGEAALINPAIPVGVNAKGFAVTLEPESGSAQPTSSILMVGTI